MRRRFLSLSGMGVGALVLAACGKQAAVPPTATTAPPDPTATPEPAAPAAEVVAETVADGDVEVMVGDVLDYVLESDEWPGDYGNVTFRIREAVHNGESACYIRTDASDPTFAEEVGLVYVPLLNTAALIDNVNVFYDLGEDQPAVIQRIPGDELFASLFGLFA